jgi:hypothetical protein
MKHVIETKFWLGDIVYCKVDTDGEPGMIVGVLQVPGGIKYDVAFPSHKDNVWEIELTRDRNFTPPTNSDEEGAAV